MKVIYEAERCIIKGVKWFSLIKTLESGQTFRYDKISGNSAVVISKTMALKISQEENMDIIIHTSRKDVADYFISYFNLKEDYNLINNSLINSLKLTNNFKAETEEIINYSKGVRIIHSDLWETILTFIISANNNMGRIKKSINLLADRYGEFICEIEGKSYYSIPLARELKDIPLSEIRDLGVGFRDKYILDAALKVSNLEVSLDYIETLDAFSAKEELKRIKGIGDKVADCIRLFALNKVEAFPVDVWIERVMLKYVLCDGTKYSRCEIEKIAYEIFKENSGYMQQYMFYFGINNRNLFT